MSAVAVAVATLIAAAPPDARADAAAPASSGAAPEVESPARSAFILALRGDLDDAADAAAKALAASPDDRLALVVLACVAVEQRDLARAADLAARLETTGSPRGKVTARLVERRRARPSEPMHVALAEAWKAAGQPEIGSDVSFDRDDVARLAPTLPAAAWERLSDREKAALAEFVRIDGAPPGAPAGTPGERAIAAASRPEQNPFWVNVLLASAIQRYDADTPAKRRPAAEAERRLAGALAAADPGNGYYAMIPMSPPRDGTAAKRVKKGPPLGEEELAALEAAAAAPRFEWPRSRVRAELSARLLAFDPARGEVRAAAVASRILPLYAVVLGTRAGASPPPRLRARTARTLAAVGERLRAGPLPIDRLIGIDLELRGAELAGDSAAVARAEAAREAEYDRNGRVSAARDRLGMWPLVSAMLDDVPENDAAYAKALME